MSFTDALSRISAIQQQIADLGSGQLAASTVASTATASAAADAASTDTATPSSDTSTATAFADALAQAQNGSSSSGSDAVDELLSALGVRSGSMATSAMTTASGGAGVTGASTTPLPANASSLLTADQQQFASTLAGATGLSPTVVSAWLLAEESGGAAQSRQAADNNDWLNIGYAGDGTYGSSDAIWSNPVSAADATAQWLKGESSIPGYGTASSGIQSILGAVGQSPQAQIAALQNSGWAGSGYPDLPTLYQEVVSA